MALEVARTRSLNGGTICTFPRGWGDREGVVTLRHKDSLRWDKHHPLLQNEKMLAAHALAGGSNIDGRRFGKAGFFGTNIEDDAVEED